MLDLFNHKKQTLKLLGPCQLLFFIFSVLLPQRVSAIPLNLNPNFDSQLTDWQFIGSVDASTNEAILQDNNQSVYSALFQGTLVGPGDYTLTFDFLSEISREAPQGLFPDVVFASIYLVNDLANFDLANLMFDDAIPLFDASAVGNILFEGSISDSESKPGWLHFSLSFTSLYSVVIPTFELFGLNAVDGDSRFLVDNVQLTSSEPIPEPTSLLLFAIGGVPVIAKRFRRGVSA